VERLMAQWKLSRDRAVPGLQIPLAMFAGTTAAGLLAIVSLVPPILVLPVVSLATIAGAAVAALFAWWCGADRHSSSITSWDVAGALAFIGFAAGILTDSEQILRLFGHETMAR
jgi:Flp pilus assembly protein TadB